jgi:hypothetical protein
MDREEYRSLSVRLRIGNNELEIVGSYDEVSTILDKLLPYLIPRKVERGVEVESKVKEVSDELLSIPPLSIKKGEPLTEILQKIFDTEWGHRPRPLREVMSVLETYGLYYPKSTVAVTLNRLVQRGVIRRIKKDKYFLYVSTSPLGESYEEG